MYIFTNIHSKLNYSVFSIGVNRVSVRRQSAKWDTLNTWVDGDFRPLVLIVRPRYGRVLLAVINSHIPQCAGVERKGLVVMG